MVKISFELFKCIFDKITGEPEFEIFFQNNDNEYMIIKYDGYVTFQRCGIENGSGEIRFNNLTELYEAKTIDGICLKNDWNKINDIVIDEVLSFKDDLEDIKEIYMV